MLPTTIYPPTSSSSFPLTNSSTLLASSTTTTTTTQNTTNILTSTNPSIAKSVSRKGGVIFPSVKNKPAVVNTTFTADALSFKDVKVIKFKSDFFLRI